MYEDVNDSPVDIFEPPIKKAKLTVDYSVPGTLKDKDMDLVSKKVVSEVISEGKYWFLYINSSRYIACHKLVSQAVNHVFFGLK